MKGNVAQCIREAKERRAQYRQNAEKLRNLPQKAVSPWEMIAYLLLPALLITAGIFPVAALYFIPIMLSLLFLVYRRFGIIMPLFALAAYGATALALNYDVISVLYLCVLTVGFAGLVLSAQAKPFLLAAIIAALFTFCGALIGGGIVCSAEGASVPEVAERYILSHPYDAIIAYKAESEYDKADDIADKLSREDDGYHDKAIHYYAESTRDDFKLYALYYAIHYFILFGGVGYFVAVSLGRRTAGPYDEGMTEGELNSNSRALGGVRREEKYIAEMRVPRLYLLVCLLPAFIASVILDIAGLNNISAMVMHGLITLPSEFAFITLMMFFASLFTGRKARIAAKITVIAVGVASVFVPVVLFACSILGTCDIVLNLRYWVRLLASDEK